MSREPAEAGVIGVTQVARHGVEVCGRNNFRLDGAMPTLGRGGLPMMVVVGIVVVVVAVVGRMGGGGDPCLRLNVKHSRSSPLAKKQTSKTRSTLGTERYSGMGGTSEASSTPPPAKNAKKTKINLKGTGTNRPLKCA